MQQILDNRSRGNVGDYLKAQIKKDSKLSIVSAYFTVYAYNELKKELNKIEGLRFLFGEPTFIKDENFKKQKEFVIQKEERESAVFGRDVEIKLKNSMNQKSIAQECAAWIREKVEIRSLKKPDFLHGKAYIIENDDEDKSAVVGSSNFTVSGLGLKSHANMELNLVTNNNESVKELLKWFDEIWNDEDIVEDVKEQVLEQIQTLYIENTPEFLYFVTLYNIFNSFVQEVDEEDIIKEATGFNKTTIWNMLYNFQRDAVVGAINKLESYGGCILADSVGLGKTFEALAVIKYYELRNHRVLVLPPKKLRDNWIIYTQNDKRNILLKDRFSFDVLNHTDLSREGGLSGDINLETINWGNYDLVVIDESHNFRNNPPVKGRKTRYSKLMEDIIKSGVKTKVLMLSATPVNNKMNDLKNQIAFITEGKDYALADNVGIKSIDVTLREAQRRFAKWTELPDGERTTESLLDSLNYDYFNLLNTLTIARSRKHIQKYYNIDDIGKFPERLKPISIKADIDVNNDFPDLKTVNDTIRKLKLAIYSPLTYVRLDKKQVYSNRYDMLVLGGRTLFRQIDREASLVSLMRVNLFKRLESSVNSFSLSLGKLINDIEKMIKLLDCNADEYVEDLNINEIDIDDSQFEDLLIGNKVKVLVKDIDAVRMKQDLYEDLSKLQYLQQETAKINAARDAKLADLKRQIQAKLNHPINDSNKKVMVFTAFADTAKYLYNEISIWAIETLGLHSGLVTGSDNCKTTIKGLKHDFTNILSYFSPISKSRNQTDPDAVEEIDILIATDCISEGQNLQDCDYLINYDIHWNPVRIIQRFGRIDRLGSKNKQIQLVNFWPNVELDEYINLEARVNNKMVLLDVSATGEENLINMNDKDKMNDLEYRRKQLEQLQKDVLDMEELAGGISITDFTLDDFKMDLLRYIKENPGKLEKTPTGIHALVPKKDKLKSELDNGIIFCLRQINNERVAKDTNSLHPYYLVYISDLGEIKYAHSKAKKILDIYKGLCSGEKEVYQELCDEFNQDTKDGADMKKYTGLLENCVSSIMGIKEEKGIESLFRLGGTTILTDKMQGLDDFELISFLIIR